MNHLARPREQDRAEVTTEIARHTGKEKKVERVY